MREGQSTYHLGIPSKLTVVFRNEYKKSVFKGRYCLNHAMPLYMDTFWLLIKILGGKKCDYCTPTILIWNKSFVTVPRYTEG